MKNKIRAISCFYLLLLSCGEVAHKSDDSYARVISLSPHITEIIYALNQDERLIAVTDYCNFPPQAENKESIGGLFNANLEKIMSSRADLVLGVPAQSDLAWHLKQTDIKIILLANNTLDDIFSSIDSIGSILGVKDRAQGLLKAIQDSLNYYVARAQAVPFKKRKAMLVLGREQGTTRKIGVIGTNNFMDSIWTMLGGINIYGDLPLKFAQISLETILLHDPDLIIEFKTGPDRDDREITENIKEWEDLNMLKAVRNNSVYVLSGDYTLIPGPRLYLLARDYYSILQRLNNKL